LSPAARALSDLGDGGSRADEPAADAGLLAYRLRDGITDRRNMEEVFDSLYDDLEKALPRRFVEAVERAVERGLERLPTEGRRSRAA
jgi:hypothetical protein